MSEKRTTGEICIQIINNTDWDQMINSDSNCSGSETLLNCHLYSHLFLFLGILNCLRSELPQYDNIQALEAFLTPHDHEGIVALCGRILPLCLHTILWKEIQKHKDIFSEFNHWLEPNLNVVEFCFQTPGEAETT